jgi:hypothetical protein
VPARDFFSRSACAPLRLSARIRKLIAEVEELRPAEGGRFLRTEPRADQKTPFQRKVREMEAPHQSLLDTTEKRKTEIQAVTAAVINDINRFAYCEDHRPTRSSTP